MTQSYSDIKIDIEEASKIAKELYSIQGEIETLDGESDFNFRIRTEAESFLLKVSRPGEDLDFINFQFEILRHVEGNELGIQSPKTFPDISGNYLCEYTDDKGQVRNVRLLSWLNGRLWSGVNPHSDKLLYSLGEEAGKLTQCLQNFDHPKAHRNYEWDIAQALWTIDYLHLFSEEDQKTLQYFQNRFKAFQNSYSDLRKSVVHDDVNDNNIVVSNDLENPTVVAIIDYGDAVYTQSINDLAVTLAYAIMGHEDSIGACLPLIKGYHKAFPIHENELDYLYTLVSMQLIITVTKAAINKEREPENLYHVISEKPAWDALRKWIKLNPNLAKYHFRQACGFTSHPKELEFLSWAQQQNSSVKDLFPSIGQNTVQAIDMSVSSTWLGHASEYTNLELGEFKMDQLRKENPDSVFCGGYTEVRPFYSTDNYVIEGNNGPEYRTIHLGIDFWLRAQTPVHVPVDGEVFSVFNNDINKDYGPTVILKHQVSTDLTFYSLYGHLSQSSLSVLKQGDIVQKGDLLGYIGGPEENGCWVPHLHFQLMLDILENQHNYPGVANPKYLDVWASLCPDPNFLFKEDALIPSNHSNKEDVISYRQTHLGKSLSLSYKNPLEIVRGSGVHLIDKTGRKYLDTVNNVAHVGHENIRVVKAGQAQMALLNTNTRYLHNNINEFARELLSTFPKELSVVHFVNSGSEANELALRMTQAYSGRRDMIAVEIGYHGNTNGCINVSSYKFDGKGGKGAPEHTHIVPLPDTFRGIYTDDNAAEKYADHVNTQIENVQAKGRELAGFICESIISCGGQIELPDNYLRMAYKAVREAGGICISDEVQVGVGRVGSHFWGFQLHGVIPDIVTIGKPLGNGHPLAAVVCTQEVAERFANGMEYFNTFGGNPVSCAIGREVLRVVKDDNLQENALKTGEFLKSELKKLQEDFPVIQDIRGQGLFLGFELVDADKKPLPKKANYLVNRMKDFGILMSTDGKDHNAIKIKPPIIFNEDNAKELLKRMKTVLKEDYFNLTYE